MSTVGLAIRPVKGIEERAVNQGTGPDHAAGVDKETAKETTHGEADQLCGEDKENLVCTADRLVVEDALRGDDIGRICTTDNDIGHNGDQDMFFDVERTRVQRPGVTQGLETGGRKDAFEGFAKG